MNSQMHGYYLGEGEGRKRVLIALSALQSLKRCIRSLEKALVDLARLLKTALVIL